MDVSIFNSSILCTSVTSTTVVLINTHFCRQTEKFHLVISLAILSFKCSPISYKWNSISFVYMMSSGHSNFLSGIYPFSIEFVLFLYPVASMWFAKVFSQCLYFNSVYLKILGKIYQSSLLWFGCFLSWLTSSSPMSKVFHLQFIHILHGPITLY